MPTADSIAAKAAAAVKSGIPNFTPPEKAATNPGMSKPTAAQLAAAKKANPIDPSAGRYAALEAAAKSSPGAFAAISAAQKSQAAASIKKADPPPPPKTKPVVTTPVSSYKDRVERSIVSETSQSPTTGTTSSGNTSGGSTSGGSSVTPTPPSAVFIIPDSPVKQVKVANSDVVQIKNDTLPIDLLSKFLFESIAAQELISISRNDLLNGQDISYQPISNIGEISLQYSSDNIIFMPETINNYFKNFNVVLNNYVYEDDTIEYSPNIRVNSTTGALTLEFANLAKDQQVEVQIITEGNIYNGTPYA